MVNAVTSGAPEQLMMKGNATMAMP